MSARVIEVDPERLDRWLAGFADRHGPFDATREETPGGAVIRATAADGSSIVATPFAHEPVGVILVRRGGYAVGLASAGTLTASKVGTRHVQSRTAAGGWSQQRFARRRGKQADELVDAVVAHSRRVLLGEYADPGTGRGYSGAQAARGRELPRVGVPRALVVGGDRMLVREVLDASALRALAGLPLRELYDLPDPKRPVLLDAVRRGRAVRVELVEPDVS